MLFRKWALHGQENSSLQKYLLMQFPSEKNNCWLYSWTEIPAPWFEQKNSLSPAQFFSFSLSESHDDLLDNSRIYQPNLLILKDKTSKPRLNQTQFQVCLLTLLLVIKSQNLLSASQLRWKLFACLANKTVISAGSRAESWQEDRVPQAVLSKAVPVLPEQAEQATSSGLPFGVPAPVALGTPSLSEQFPPAAPGLQWSWGWNPSSCMLHSINWGSQKGSSGPLPCCLSSSETYLI